MVWRSSASSGGIEAQRVGHSSSAGVSGQCWWRTRACAAWRRTRGRARLRSVPSQAQGRWTRPRDARAGERRAAQPGGRRDQRDRADLRRPPRRADRQEPTSTWCCSAVCAAIRQPSVRCRVWAVPLAFVEVTAAVLQPYRPPPVRGVQKLLAGHGVPPLGRWAWPRSGIGQGGCGPSLGCRLL